MIASCTEEKIESRELKIVNPYEDYGIQHNQMLERFSNVLMEKTPTVAEIENGFHLFGFDGFNFDFPIEKLLTEPNYSPSDYINELPISHKARKTLLSVDDAIEKENTENLLHKIVIEVLHDPEFTETERKAILIGCSIAKHSKRYWSENFDFWQNPKHINQKDVPSGSDITGDIIKNDVVAGVGGAIALGLATGGAGAGAGAVRGAAGASAATGLYYGTWWVLDQIGENTGWWDL